jgi:hypothetical protein
VLKGKWRCCLRDWGGAGGQRALAGEVAPLCGGGPVTVDLDATIVIAHSDKEQATPIWVG